MVRGSANRSARRRRRGEAGAVRNGERRLSERVSVSNSSTSSTEADPEIVPRLGARQRVDRAGDRDAVVPLLDTVGVRRRCNG